GPERCALTRLPRTAVGIPGASAMRHPAGARTRAPRGPVRGRFEGRLCKGLRQGAASTTRPLHLSPRRPGGEGRVRGADEPVRGAAHLTLPSLRGGPLPLPPEGRRGAGPGREYAWLA